ncbi:diguanylate cyclase [Roseomonas sp. KE2513]|uniref:GGDEF domain-containing protein n=1 Tax=Roseomonas sp. KE2513 TaxID=2479202 RepID=UPI0018DFAD95|nr:sensor domain-containing diguanylate cyclase [Roseomonas sp. KE2513]
MRMTLRLGIGWRHGLIVAMVFGLVGAAVSALLLREERRLVVAETGERMVGYADAMARRLDAGLSEWAADVGLLARFETFEREPAEPAAARRLLEALRLRSPTFSWIGFVGADGRVIAATGGLLEGVDVSSRPWFKPGLAGLHLGDVHPAVLLARLLPSAHGGGENAYFIDAAAPVRTPDGRVLGVVSGHLTWRWADVVRSEVMSLAPAHPPMTLRILAADGTVLLGPDTERGRPWVQDPAPPTGPHARLWQEATGADGRAVILARARVDGDPDRPSLGWTVLAETDRNVALARLNSFALWLGAATLGLAVMGGLVAGRTAGRIEAALGAAGGQGGPRNVVARLEALRDQAWRDPLTGLLNRAGFEAWHEEHRGAVHGYAVAALDLDGFKPINDRYGHAAGDDVLRAIGVWLRDNLRKEDVAIRTGGDEFVLVFPSAGSSAQPALEVGARLNAMLQAGVPRSAGRLSLGCSLGVALMPGEAATIAEAMALADSRLYEAKRSKGNARSSEAAGAEAG